MASAPKWQAIITDLSGVQKGDLVNFSGLKVATPLMRLPTASLTLPLHASRAKDVMDNDRLLKLYRTAPGGTKKLVFHGPIMSAEENGEANAQSIAINAVGPFWRLQRRIVPGTENPLGIPRYPATGDEDLGVLAHWILTNVNGASNTGVKVGTRTGTFPKGVATLGNLKPAAEAIMELATGLSSFEFDVVPIEAEAAGSWPYIGRMDVAPTIGFVSRTNAIFEYGTQRANVSSYKRTIDRSTMMTKGWIASPTWTELNTPNGIIVATADTEPTRGRFEDVVPDGGMSDNTIRTDLLNEHISVRKNPRHTVTFTVAVNARPMPYVDYNVGDFVRARAVIRGSVRFDAMFRIWGISFTVDKNGNESVELEMTPP